MDNVFINCNLNTNWQHNLNKDALNVDLDCFLVDRPSSLSTCDCGQIGQLFSCNTSEIQTFM